ncbi:MAG: hypothetical protein FWE36_05120 [Erysipelotrichales bacterium]|nr:hypothetical protein [Erysipelotrichales bacterium]
MNRTYPQNKNPVKRTSAEKYQRHREAASGYLNRISLPDSDNKERLHCKNLALYHDCLSRLNLLNMQGSTASQSERERLAKELKRLSRSIRGAKDYVAKRNFERKGYIVLDPKCKHCGYGLYSYRAKKGICIVCEKKGLR